jgi:hypothetical protein
MSYPVMLKLTLLTVTHSSHAETDDFDLDTFQPCMLKLTILIMKYSSQAETDIFAFGATAKEDIFDS